MDFLYECDFDTGYFLFRRFSVNVILDEYVGTKKEAEKDTFLVFSGG